MIQDIKIVKLVSGEELFCEYDAKAGTVKNPLTMIPVNNEKLAFTKWLPYSDDEVFSIEPHHILVVAQPSDAMLNEYNRLFGSGIVVPSGEKLVH
tara:strand:+ start:1105 stop:1389 length:285 start_codon:yes stop_codon:yes gene_type:complete